ncbi:MAG: hypothetical protein ACR2L1_08000 [Pyrinomonadaceae bacterium]
MLKKIVGWGLVILGFVFALCGVLAVMGGAGVGLLGRLSLMGMIVAGIGLRTLAGQNK